LRHNATRTEHIIAETTEGHGARIHIDPGVLASSLPGWRRDPDPSLIMTS